MSDPWRKLAVESQARRRYPDHPETSPAVLEILEDAVAKVHGQPLAILEHEIHQLQIALMRGRFAMRLIKAIWGPKATLKEHREEKTELNALVNDVVSNSELN